MLIAAPSHSKPPLVLILLRSPLNDLRIRPRLLLSQDENHEEEADHLRVDVQRGLQSVVEKQQLHEEG